MEDGTYFDRALLVTCIDGLGRYNRDNDRTVYQKDIDTLGAHLLPLSNDGTSRKHDAFMWNGSHAQTSIDAVLGHPQAMCRAGLERSRLCVWLEDHRGEAHDLQHFVFCGFRCWATWRAHGHQSHEIGHIAKDAVLLSSYCVCRLL